LTQLNSADPVSTYVVIGATVSKVKLCCKLHWVEVL